MSPISFFFTLLPLMLTSAPAVALSRSCYTRDAWLLTTFENTALICLPGSIVAYTYFTRKFPTLPVFSLLTYFLYILIVQLFAGIGATDSCVNNTPEDILFQTPTPIVAGAFLLTNILATIVILIKTRRTHTNPNAKTQALFLHLTFLVIMALLPLLTVSQYDYWKSPPW